MSRALLVSVRFHDGRCHGRPEWPPSPARLFQALVAGSATGGKLCSEDRAALGWLERLPPPMIAAPPARPGGSYRNYVPNNDLDAVGRDPARVAEIRTPKLIKPFLFDARTPLVYAWEFEQEHEPALRLCAIAERLYQLGRGVDMAWACGEIIDAAELHSRLREFGGALYRPAGDGEGMKLACPADGSLDSLIRRFQSSGKRFTTIETGRTTQQVFSQAPKPRFAAIDYSSPPPRFLFELRQPDGAFAPWPLTQI